MKTKQLYNLINGMERTMFKQLMAIIALALSITFTAGVQAQVPSLPVQDPLASDAKGVYFAYTQNFRSKNTHQGQLESTYVFFLKRINQGGW